MNILTTRVANFGTGGTKRRWSCYPKPQTGTSPTPSSKPLSSHVFTRTRKQRFSSWGAARLTWAPISTKTALHVLLTATLALFLLILWKRSIRCLMKWIVSICLTHSWLTFQLFPVCIDQEMDVTDSLDEVYDQSFNCILDKGTLDCVACAEEDSQGKLERMLENMHRVLAPGGCFICISRGAPETRLIYFSSPRKLNWTVETLKVQK